MVKKVFRVDRSGTGDGMNGRESAETVALRALGWIAGDAERLGAFLGASGLDPATLRARAADPEMLASVLDFLLADDAQVLAFAADAGLAPEAALRARAALPGGDLPHWT